MFILGYWALGNRQIFYGEASPVSHDNEVVNPNHDLVNFDDIFKHEGLILILLALLLTAKIGIKIYNYYSTFNHHEEDHPEDEGLAPFWNSLTGEV